MLTVFICITGENWNEIMHLVCHQFGPFYAFYFVSIVICGNFMLLNLFLAILLKYIDEMNTEHDYIAKEALKTSRKEQVIGKIKSLIEDRKGVIPSVHPHAQNDNSEN
jgi:hypothetical protein